MAKIRFKLLWIVAALVLAEGVYFIYGVVPSKVAQSIMEKTQVQKPLTKTPADDGFKFKDVTFLAEGGITLKGWFLPPAGKKKLLGTVVLSHGVFKNREQVLSRAEFLAQAGYQVLLFDQRGNGMSSASPTSGGLFESNDFLAGGKYLKDQGLLKKPLVFFGFSMGAMSALRAASKDTELDGVIADSPLANIKAYVSKRTTGGKFASLPGFLDRCLDEYDKMSGLSLAVGDLDMVPVVEKLHELPVLYLTGEKDDLAKSEEVKKLFEKSASHHRRLVYIPDAGHEQTFDQYPIIYAKAVLSFLQDIREGFPAAKE